MPLSGDVQLERFLPTRRKVVEVMRRFQQRELPALGEHAIREAIDRAGIRKQRGQLRNSWRWKPEIGGGAGRWLSDHPGADLLDGGGTVRPVRGRALAIPVGPALRPDGTPWKSSPRFVMNLHPARNSDGSGVLLDSEGRVWYILARSVTIPSRPYQERAAVLIEERVAERLETLLSDVLEGG